MKRAKYAAYFLIMILCARATLFNGIRPFDIGVFLGLVYAGENMAILAPLFVAALFIIEPTINTLILSIGTVLLSAGLYFLSFKLKKRVNLLEMNVVAFLSRLPILLLSINKTELLTDTLVTLIISQVFSYVALISIYAIIKRGIRNRLTTDELAGASIGIIVIFLSIYQIEFLGFTPYYVLVPFIIVALIYCIGYKAILVAAILGISSALSTIDLDAAAAVILCSLIALMFRKMPIPFIAGAYLVGDIGAAFLFKYYGQFNSIHLISVIIGLIAAIALPPKIYMKLASELGGLSKGLAPRTIINMSRYELSAELAALSKAFYDIELALKKEVRSENNDNISEYIREELCERVCGGCEKKEDCYYNRKEDISDLFLPIIKGAVDRGRANIIDVPPLLTSVCRKINTITQAAGDMARSYVERRKEIQEVDRAKYLLGEQSAGISSLISDLSRKTSRSVTADENYEERLIEDLAYRNVVCNEILLWNDTEKGITLIVRNEDKDKKIIDKIINKRTGINWIRSDINCEYTNGLSAITFLPAPQYDLLCAECMATKTGSILSGDTRSITHISHDKYMIALCDGMGTGEAAEMFSSTALTIIENLYLAGFNSDTIIKLANNLLSISREDSFSALDMAIVDLSSGFCDFIKLGGVNGFIRTDNGIEVIEGGALPLGIVTEIKPAIRRRRLTVDELCLIVSDGVLDTIGVEQVDKILVNNPPNNPQLITNEIVKACLKRGLKDDITAIAFRLFIRLP